MLWSWNISQKVCHSPADACLVVWRDQIPPHISIYLARTILHEEHLRIISQELKSAIESRFRADAESLPLRVRDLHIVADPNPSWRGWRGKGINCRRWGRAGCPGWGRNHRQVGG